MKVTREQFAKKLVKLFPEKKQALRQHYEDFGELLGHIFFYDEINIPLSDLLQKNDAGFKISAYCRFIEEMWRNGTDDVVNIVDVTVVECLSDDETVWNRFGKNISNEFKAYINDDLLKGNILMRGVAKLDI
ncbi:MAG: hypothetical protein HFI17_17970 [Lachnospiraceae bacterium]|nr:hypothetical protein [Lachnospiraceae bacterium]